MERILPILQNVPLFSGFEPKKIPGVLRHLDAGLRAFGPGQFIFLTGDPATHVGIVCGGSALVVKEDFTGNRSILAALGTGDLFGEAFACSGVDRLPVSVVAREDCSALLFDFRRVAEATVTHPCHGKLIRNMMAVLAGKNVMLNQKINVLSGRSTREKLITYLTAVSQATGSHIFAIPFNRQQLADYLCVDRSAMTTELSKLKREGLLDFHKNHFVLSRARQPEC